MCWLRAGERSGGIALILRWRPPAYDHPRRLSRCVLGQPGEPAAELNRSRRLAGLVEGGQDRGDVGFINCEHTWSMSAVGRIRAQPTRIRAQPNCVCRLDGQRPVRT